jgi:hypothetical protein
VGTVCHRYSLIHVLFSVVLCSGFAGMHPTFYVCLPHQDLYAKIATDDMLALVRLHKKEGMK